MNQNAQPTEARQWLDTAKAAQILGVSVRSIQRRCQAGTLPGRRTKGARGLVWQVEAQAVEAERMKGDSDGDKGDTTTATRATATTTSATPGQRVAVILPFPRSVTATPDDDSDGDAATATATATSAQVSPSSVAVEAEKLKAELAASRAETERERELSAFLKTQIEEANRNAAELRAALRKALEIAPRQLTQGSAADGPQREQNGAPTNDGPTNASGPQKPAEAQQKAPITYDSIADEIERMMNQ